MFGNSSPVRSNQPAPEPGRLARAIKRHRVSEYCQPVRDYSREIFQAVDRVQRSLKLPVILDSGCGNGESSARLAAMHPDRLVVGVDKSIHRLHKHGLEENLFQRDNLLIARSGLVDFWRLAARAGWRLDEHHLMYPNPWPKQKHRKRRWYAHPVFPDMLRLGGRLEVRSNWFIYIEEFAMALQYDGYASRIHRLIAPLPAASPFERKYRASGHRLYTLVADLDRVGCN